MSDVSLEKYEHADQAALDKDKSSTQYQPTPEERKTIKRVMKHLDEAKRARSKHDQSWLKYYKLFRGKQWDDNRPTYRHSEVINLIFTHLQSTIPQLTDSRPRIEFISKKPDNAEFSKILNQLVENDWDEQNWTLELIEMLYDSHLYGTAFGCCGYNPKARYGLGAIEFESADPFYQFPDPSSRKINDKRQRYYIEAEPVDIHLLKEEYPDKAQFIKSDLDDLSSGIPNRDEMDPKQLLSPTYDPLRADMGGDQSPTPTERALKITEWCFSNEIEEEEKERDGENGAKVKYYVQKKKYPKGRKTVIASGVVLCDKENEFEDGKVPRVRLINYPLPREFWGQSEIEPLESPQRIFNKLISFTLDVLTMMGNPIWIVDSNSGIDTDTLYNAPGSVFEPEPGSRMERVKGVELQGYVLPLIDRMKTWFDSVAGSFDMTRGAEPTDVTAASAIQEIKDSQQTRARQKSRLLDATIQDFGQMYLSRVLQFYSAPRIIMFTGNDDAVNYFKFHVETMTNEAGEPDYDDQGNMKRIAKITPYRAGADGKFYADQEQDYPVHEEFKVRVATGTMLPFAKAKKQSDSYRLFDMGIIDEQEVLKNMEYPNAEAVLMRVADRKKLQAQVESDAKQGNPPQNLPPEAFGAEPVV